LDGPFGGNRPVPTPITTSLLANIALDPLDKELAARGHKFARYADDFIVMAKSANTAKRVLAALIRYCEGRLKLVVCRHRPAPVVALFADLSHAWPSIPHQELSTQ